MSRLCWWNISSFFRNICLFFPSELIEETFVFPVKFLCNRRKFCPSFTLWRSKRQENYLLKLRKFDSGKRWIFWKCNKRNFETKGSNFIKAHLWETRFFINMFFFHQKFHHNRNVKLTHTQPTKHIS